MAGNTLITPWQNKLSRLMGRKTPEELAEVKAQRALRERVEKLKAQLDVEAAEAERKISQALADMEICYARSQDGKRVIRQRIRFYGRVVSEEALYLLVDLRPGKRPVGVGVKQLTDPDVVKDLGLSIGRKVEAEHDERRGLCYIVQRQEGVRGVPSHVMYDDVAAARPAKADSMWVPLGMGEGKKVIWQSMLAMRNVMIAGTTGGGKSNQMAVMLATLVAANRPERFKLALVDWKRVELGWYRNLPHLAKYHVDGEERKAFATGPDETVAMLSWLRGEVHRRIGLLEADGGAKNVEQYNQRHRLHRLPYIYLVVDEWAMVALDRGVGQECLELLIEIASVGRAMGIGCIVATQYPNAKVVDMRIKSNMPAIMSFTLPNMHASQAVLGDSSAFRLSEAPGRYMFQFGMTSLEIQAPWLPNEKLTEILDLAGQGQTYKPEAAEARTDVTDQEIVEWAVAHDCRMGERSVATAFAGRGLTQSLARSAINRMAGSSVTVNGTEYRVIRGIGVTGTRLERLDETQNANATPETAPEAV